MSTQINSPFLLPKLRPISELSKTENNYHEQLERILQQIYRRIGGPIDSVDDNLEESSANENQISHIYGLVAELSNAVSDLAADSVGQAVDVGFRAVTISGSYTAVDHDFINAKLGGTITLPKYPEENTIVIIRNGDFSNIKLSLNGKSINGSSTGEIQQKGTALDIYYFIDSDEWLVG